MKNNENKNKIKYCPYCGAPLSEDGRHFAAESHKTSAKTDIPKVSYDENTVKSSHVSSRVFIVFTSVAVILFIGIVAFLFFGPNRHIPTESFTVNGVKFDMVKVEHGTFTMGATREQVRDSYQGEYPAHEVVIAKDFYVGQTEVTQQLWQAVMGYNPSYFRGDGNRPVENVTWFECQQFVKKLSSLTGRKFRLMTEQEWEYTARGGNRSRHTKYSGSNTLGDVAWYYDNSDNRSHRVKQMKKNELGIYDMSGNVWEWCSDVYRRYSSTVPPARGTGDQDYCMRGGSFDDDQRFCRVALRGMELSTSKYKDVGLRLALDL